jgi:hypothetical protein
MASISVGCPAVKFHYYDNLSGLFIARDSISWHEAASSTAVAVTGEGGVYEKDVQAQISNKTLPSSTGSLRSRKQT